MVTNAVLFFCWDTLVLALVVGWFHGQVRYRDLLPVRAASYVAAVFNTHLARGALAAYLSRRLGAPLLQLGGTVLFLLITEYLHLTAWATVGLLLVRGRVPGPLLWIPPAVAVAWLAVLLYTRLEVTPARGWHRLLAPRDWSLLRTLRAAHPGRYGQTVAWRAPMLLASVVFHALAAPAFGIAIPFPVLLAFLPVVFMLAALPVTVAHLGTTQAAWIVLFGPYAPEERLLAFSLAAHLTFTCTRALLGLVFLPRAWGDLVQGRPDSARQRRIDEDPVVDEERDVHPPVAGEVGEQQLPGLLGGARAAFEVRVRVEHLEVENAAPARVRVPGEDLQDV
jgi:hypothetical protein